MEFKTERTDKPWGHELLIALVPKKYAGKLLVIDNQNFLFSHCSASLFWKIYFEICKTILGFHVFGP